MVGLVETGESRTPLPDSNSLHNSDIIQLPKLFVASFSEGKHPLELDPIQLLHELLDHVVSVGQIAQEISHMLDSDVSTYKTLNAKNKGGRS